MNALSKLAPKVFANDNIFTALPFGRPALYAYAHQAHSLGPSGNDQEHIENERDFFRPHSFPLRSLRARCF